MAKYIDADLLIKEINRLYQEHSCRDYCDEACSVLDQLEDFIDSLQQEQPDVNLEKELAVYKDFHGDWWGHTPDGRNVGDCFDFSDIEKFARHFYELGQKDAANKYDEIEYSRQREEKEMPDKTLDDAADEYAKVFYHSLEDRYSIAPQIKYDSFKAGAKWMAEQGLTKGGVVTEDNDFIKFDDGTYIDFRPDLVSKSFDLKPGDKVIVQIMKKEESK